MKKLFALLVLVITIFSLVACGGDGDIPDDMQIASGSEGLGYYFYAPDGWFISEVNNITTAYVSKVNNTSISFVKISPDDFGRVSDEGCGVDNCRGASLDSATHFFLYHYFDSTKGDFPDSLSVKESKNVAFGKEGESAENARSYQFSYTYKNVISTEKSEEVSCGFIQYFIAHKGSYYILTYSAIADVPEGLENSNFDKYLDKLDMVIKNFRFLSSPLGESEEITEYPKDSDGYLHIAEGSLAGFDFYSHESFSDIISTGYVSVTHSDGSNVTMSKASATGVSIKDYVLRRGEELIVIGATNFKILTDFEKEGQQNGVPSRLGNLPEGESNTAYDFAFEFEYTYAYKGENYHVYQILAVSGNAFHNKAFVFTYTAKEANYSAHINEVYTMRDKVYIE